MECVREDRKPAVNSCRGRLAASSLALALTGAAFPQSITPFTQEAVNRGLVYVMQPQPSAYGYVGFGCGFVDLDNDGDQDVIIIGATNTRIGIFENNGSGIFTDRSVDNGIPLLPHGSAFAAADYDADGLIDLYLSQCAAPGSGAMAPNFLVRNLGNFQFLNVTQIAGVNDLGPGKSASWGDYDGDGWLDLYLCNYTDGAPNYLGFKNKLFRNNGNGTFTDVSFAQGVDNNGLTFQSVWFDLERDGDLDLYIANDRGHQNGKPNQLYRNDNGQMVNISAGSGADVAIFAMGIGAGDFDRNGFTDLYVTNITTPAPNLSMINPLLMNQGNGTFVESAVAAGVNCNSPSGGYWGAIFFDFDNDTNLDIYVNHQFQPNILHRNTGTWPCTNVAAAAGVQGTSAAGVASFSSAVADVNNDGAMDLLLNNLGGNVQLFINHEAQERNWVRYRLVGVHPNLNAVGASVDTRIGSVWQFREIYAGGNSYLGQNELPIHVGAGTATLVDEAVVRWPGGSPTRTLTNLPINHTWTIYPPQSLGDFNADSAVDLADFLHFASCFGSVISPGCEMMDFDGDSQIDLDDFNAFLAVYAGRQDDCNDNGIVDLQDILLDPALDQNSDGVIDSCKQAPCAPDISPAGGDGVVNVGDLLAVINAWGPCPAPPLPCPADINRNGTVDVGDLLAIINGWGNCP